MINYFYGDDSFRIQSAIDNIVSRKKEAQVLRFDKSAHKELLLSLASQSFFDPFRIFVLEEVLSSLKEKELDKLLSQLKGQEKKLLLVAVEKKAPSKNLTPHISETGQFEVLKGGALIAFIKEKVAQEGGDISPLAAERLAGYVGNNLWQIEEEVKKLVLYKKDNNEVIPIETADVDLLVHATFEANIFNFVDAVATKNTKRAESLLGSFMSSGENPLYLLTMITKQIRNIAIIKFDNVSEANFAQRAGVHPFVAKKSFQQSKNFSQLEVAELYRRLVWADVMLKSGGEPGQVLQKLIV
jgi:DNA polymerase III subunit delta